VWGERVRACSDWSSRGVSLYFIFFIFYELRVSSHTTDLLSELILLRLTEYHLFQQHLTRSRLEQLCMMLS